MTAKDRTNHNEDTTLIQDTEGWDAFSVWNTRVRIRDNQPTSPAPPSTGWDAYEVWQSRVKRSPSSSR